MATLIHQKASQVASAAAKRTARVSEVLKLPEFIPLPSGGRVEFYSGLQRGSLNQLILPCKANDFAPPVKSINVVRPGKRKGRRLVVLEGVFGKQDGLLTYLRKLRDQQPNTEVQP